MPEPQSARADERALVARAQRGDLEAFATLYQANAGRVFGLCLRMTGDRQRATELLQDVFVRIWERLASYRGESSFSTWAYRLTINAVLEAGRKNARRGARVEYGGEPDAPIASTGSSVELRIDLEKALASLPAGARRVFVLHDVEGYQHKEIARMTGLAEGTLRAQLHRARQLLMEALDR